MTLQKDKLKTKINRDKDLPILSFETAIQWERWLAKNHDACGGVWLQIQKKDSERRSLTYGEALDAALCYGWIDGQKKSNDGGSWLQKFVRRGAKSGWSKRNTENVE